jgi:hypothetical protein
MYTVLLITIGALFLIYLGIAIAALLRPAPTPRYPDYTLEFIRNYVQELVHKHLMEAGIIVTRGRDSDPIVPGDFYTAFCLTGGDVPFRIRLVDQQYIAPKCETLIQELRRAACISVVVHVRVRERNGYPEVTIDVTPR